MAEGRSLRADVVIVGLLLLVLVGGFWMTGRVADEKGEALQNQIGQLSDSVRQMSLEVTEMHNIMKESKSAHPAAAAPIAAAAAPAPAAKK